MVMGRKHANPAVDRRGTVPDRHDNTLNRYQHIDPSQTDACYVQRRITLTAGRPGKLSTGHPSTD